MARVKRAALEQTEQILFFELLEPYLTTYSTWKYWHHIPNGEDRHVAVARKLKQMGTKAGIADVQYPIPRGRYIGCWLEFKRPANKLLAETKPAYKRHAKVRAGSDQDAFLRDMAANGHFVQVVHKAEQAFKLAMMYEKGLLDEAPVYPAVLEIA